MRNRNLKPTTGSPASIYRFAQCKKLDAFKSVCEKYRLEVEKSSDDAMG